MTAYAPTVSGVDGLSLSAVHRLHRTYQHPQHLAEAGETGDCPQLQPVWNSPLCFVERLTCGSPDRKATFAGAHSNSLRSLLSVLPCESPDGSSGKKATFAALTPPASPTLGDLRIFPGFSRLGKCDSRERSESEHRRCVIPANLRAAEGPMREFPSFSWLGTHRSVLSSGSPAVRRTERQRSLTLTPTHFVRCCPFCRANRLTALRAKRQRSLRSLLRLRLRCPVLRANRLWLFGRTGTD